MKTVNYFLAGVLVTVFMGASVNAQEAVGINFFDLSQAYTQSYTYWDNGKSYVYVGGSATFTRSSGNAVPVDMSVGNGSLVFQSTLPSGWWNLEFKLDGGHSVNFLRYGQSPLLYLRLKWDAIAPGANVDIELRDDQAIWNLYSTYNGTGPTHSSQSASVRLSNFVTPSTQWQDVYIPMSAFLARNPFLDLTRISILKFYGVGTYSVTNTMYIEKMKIVPGINSQYSDMVKVNQLGYLPEGRKLAIVSYEPGAVAAAPTYFQLREAQTDAVVYEANLQLKTRCKSEWDLSGDTVYHADFTSFSTPGWYVLYCPELDQVSPAFEIGDKAFNGPFRDALRFFYYARSGNVIAEPFAEGHPRPTIYAGNSACAYDYDDNDITKKYDYGPQDAGITTRDVLGGWFDAGDLHMDIHNNITTLWFLLELLEGQMDKLGPNLLKLPESDGQTNDLVLLIKYELDWFKKMQNPNGSVHFMVITENGNQRYQQVSDVSTGAACILAGIFAKAYPLFSTVPGMESYAADLLSRAELSWTWLTANTATYNPKDMYGNTWSYGIPDDREFRSFAALELYIATGSSTYRTYFESRYTSAKTSLQGILNPLGKAHMDYAETDRPTTSSIRNAIRSAYTSVANTIVSNTDCAPYRVPMRNSNELYWGSSGMLACNAYISLRVYEWTGNTQYRDAALDALEWIGGRNPVCRVFITGYGDYLHGTDHYSFYMFDHLNPVPGYLCGNINCSDSWLNSYIPYRWKDYLNIQNASLLEPCLPWQAEMCYLLGYFASDLKTPGDLNFNGTVNVLDLIWFSSSWLSTETDQNWNPYADISQPADGIISYPDFSVFAEHLLNMY
jgi:hypothetical protein